MLELGVADDVPQTIQDFDPTKLAGGALSPVPIVTAVPPVRAQVAAVPSTRAVKRFGVGNPKPLKGSFGFQNPSVGAYRKVSL